jgi:hypothetical protein
MGQAQLGCFQGRLLPRSSISVAELFTPMPERETLAKILSPNSCE